MRRGKSEGKKRVQFIEDLPETIEELPSIEEPPLVAPKKDEKVSATSLVNKTPSKLEEYQNQKHKLELLATKMEAKLDGALQRQQYMMVIDKQSQMIEEQMLARIQHLMKEVTELKAK